MSDTKTKEPLIRIIKRDRSSFGYKVWVRAAAIILALVVDAIFIYSVTGLNPLSVYGVMLNGTFMTSIRFSWAMRDLVTLLCIGIALAPAFKMRFWNIGAEGQVLMGGLATAMVMVKCGASLPTPVLFLVMFLTSVIAGGLWGFIPAVFKAYWNTNETLFTLMMNYVATSIVACMTNILRGKASSLGKLNMSTQVGWFPQFMGQRYNINILIVMILMFVMFFYLKYSKQGYEITVVGESENTARYAGINVKWVIHFSSNEYHKFSTASLITRSTNDVQQVQQVMTMMFRIVLYAPILGIGGVIKVLQTDSSMTWILGAAVAIILIVIFVLFQIAMPKFTRLQTLIDRLNLVTREILTGIPVIRAFSREKHEEERFEKANMDLTKTNLFVNRCMTFMMPIMMLIMNGVSVAIIYFGAHGVDNGTMQVGNMMAFIQYAMQIIMSFLMITAISIMLPRANVAACRICEVLEMEPSVNDPEEPVMPDKQEKGTVEFDHVSFAYPEAGENVINDITFKAEKGQTVAIIGSTGSGKSTLINLIPRFYDATKGCAVE